MNQAIFFDRDGVLNEQPRGKTGNERYVCCVSDFHWLPETIDALRIARSSDFKLIVITNQAGIAKGYFSLESYLQIEQRIDEELKKAGLYLDATYYCPYHPSATKEEFRLDSRDRKPETGMLEKAASDHKLDLSRSFLIGDKTSDILCGVRAGCTTYLVQTGYAGSDKQYVVTPHFIVSNVLEAVNHIIQHHPSEVSTCKL